jgi:hypothetical protein
MSEQLRSKKFKEILVQYVFEILVIFLGISISFWFDEWRGNRKDKELERKHLIDLKSNLKQDTFLLSQMIASGKTFVNSSHKLATFKNDKDILDSLSFYIDNASSYTYLKANQTAYEEIKQTGHTSLITNDSLKMFILQHYTLVLPYAEEWGNIDKNYTMTQVIPEMTNYFPVVPDTTNMVSASQKIKALNHQKLRNLLLTNATYKQATLDVFINTKIQSEKLMKRIEDELKNKS